MQHDCGTPVAHGMPIAAWNCKEWSGGCAVCCEWQLRAGCPPCNPLSIYLRAGYPTHIAQAVPFGRKVLVVVLQQLLLSQLSTCRQQQCTRQAQHQLHDDLVHALLGVLHLYYGPKGGARFKP